MGRGTSWATGHGVTRVGDDLATKPHTYIYIYIWLHIYREKSGKLSTKPFALVGSRKAIRELSFSVFVVLYHLHYFRAYTLFS